MPGVVRGDVKPKTAHTVAYLAQTLMQAIHVSQHEYCEAFSSNAWRQSVRNSVNGNHDYLFPPDPRPVRITPTSTATHPHPARTSASSHLLALSAILSVAKDLIPPTPHNQHNRPHPPIPPSHPQPPTPFNTHSPPSTTLPP